VFFFSIFGFSAFELRIWRRWEGFFGGPLLGMRARSCSLSDLVLN